MKKTGPGGVRSLASLSFNLLWAGSFTLATVICFARVDLLHLMMPERASAYRWDTLGVLIWAFVPVSLTYIFGTLLTAHEQLRAMNRFFLFGIALNLGLNLVLIPRYQAFGTAIAAVLTQSSVAAGMMWLSARTFGFWPGRNWWLRTLGFALFVLLANWLVFQTELNWVLKFGSGLAAGAMGALVFRMADWRKAAAFIKK